MLGLSSSLVSGSSPRADIVKDGLVLRHDYKDRPVEPVSSGAAYFDGTSDYITIGDVFDLGTNDFTISFWCKASDLSSFRAVNKFQDDNNQIFLGFANDDKVYFLVKGGGNVVSSGKSDTACTALEDTWIHVCATAGANRSDGTGTGVIYVNGTTSTYGKAAFNLSNDDQDLDSTGSWEIGRRQESATTTYKEGYICNVGIWSAALTQPQIKSIMHKDYAALSASEKEDLVSWWNLDSTMVTANDGGKFGALDSHYGGGSELGSEMWDGTNGDTTHWVKFGSLNEIASDGGAVKITYKDNASGYYIYLKDSSHLNADLVVGKFYRLTFSTKINNGSVNWSLSEEGEDSYSASTLTSTSFITQQIDFLATATTDHYLYPASMDGTEEVWIKDISLKLINGNTGTLS